MQASEAAVARFGESVAARYEMLEFAVFTLASRVQGVVPLHAACIGRRGRGLLLMGDSGAGKSTAALLGLAQAQPKRPVLVITVMARFPAGKPASAASSAGPNCSP